jgi:methyl coenzyme M reductase beta subunit
MANNQFIKIQYCVMKTKGENIVLRYINANHLKKKHIAEKLKMSPQNLDGRLSKSALPTDFIEDLSDAINHDFFADLSKEYQRKHFNVNNFVEEPIAKYTKPGTMEAMIEKIVEQKVNEFLNKK